MTQLECNLAPTGATTFPKALRLALKAPHGGRLVWKLQADGTVLVQLKYASSEPPISRRDAATAHHRLPGHKS
jgi:hypothetical protein